MPNEVIRWVLGILFTLILGAYGYAYSVGSNTLEAQSALEARIMRQLDKMDGKIDMIFKYQYGKYLQENNGTR